MYQAWPETAKKRKQVTSCANFLMRVLSAVIPLKEVLHALQESPSAGRWESWSILRMALCMAASAGFSVGSPVHRGARLCKFRGKFTRFTQYELFYLF